MLRMSCFLLGLTAVLAGASPLFEPSVDDYFELTGDAGLVPAPIERVRNISPDEFDMRVRLGRPFIIEDAGRDNPLVGATCKQFHARFPTAKMRAEYTGGPRDRYVSLGAASWFSQDRPTAAQLPEGLVGKDKMNAPYVWHLKDGGHEAPPEVREAAQATWVKPYFIRGAVNTREANESAEFWFVRAPGAVLAHADTYCIPAVSLQLYGRKRWRLMPPPAIASSTNRYDSHDGGIYKAKLWQPTHEAVVSPGEALIFFPNQFHETLVEEADGTCAVATTFQFQHPVPVRYLRAYLPTHTMSHLYYEGHCTELWSSYATLSAPGTTKPSLKESKIRSQAEKIMNAVDVNQDKRLSEEELSGYLSALDPPWPRWFLTEDYFYDFRPDASQSELMSEEILLNRIKDTLHYMDVDGDGQASEDEVHTAVRQWNVLHKRVVDIRKSGKTRARLQALEKEYADRFPGGRAGAGPVEAGNGNRAEL